MTMESTSKAVEMTGTVDEQGHLHLDGPLSSVGPQRVRIILLFPVDANIDEQAWIHATSSNPAFDFLNDPAEDIYTLDDGKPFRD